VPGGRGRGDPDQKKLRIDFVKSLESGFCKAPVWADPGKILEAKILQAKYSIQMT
jgi:hypothetical protein